MIKEIKQKGVIQIPLLIWIIASIIVASAGVSAVLYVQNRSTTPTDDVFGEAFVIEEEPSEEILTIEGPEELEEPEESDLLTEQELEKAKLEAEKARLAAETAKAKAETERLRRETEEAEQLLEEQRKQQELQYQQQLKIEKCKAEAQLEVDKFKKELNKMYLQGLEELKNWEQAILGAQISYSECILKPIPDYLIGAHPDLQKQYRDSKCNYYLEMQKQLEKSLKEERNRLDTLFETTEKQGETEYSRIYLGCLNR